MSIPKPYQYQVGGAYPGYLTPSPPTGSQSLVLQRMNIEAGQTVKIESKDLANCYGYMFAATDLVYVGSPDIWILERSSVGGQPLFGAGAGIPCDSFRPGCPSGICWPSFYLIQSSGTTLTLLIENRGKTVGHFIARLAGNYRS